MLPLAAAAATPAAPVAGSDYTVIATPKTWQPAAGKIEVAEAFGYVCPHCAHFEPVLEAWKKKQPADVRVVTVPAPFGGYWLPYARVYCRRHAWRAAKVHDALFEALHVKGTLPMQNPSPDELATFFAGYGVDRQKFIAALRGPAVDAKLAQARDFLGNAGVDSTPSMVVAASTGSAPRAVSTRCCARWTGWSLANVPPPASPPAESQRTIARRERPDAAIISLFAPSPEFPR
jgi:thiol:disulfide interchange protein DsbA